jgi:hypothetical protein
MKTRAVVRVASYLRKIYRVSQVDTQKIRAKLMHKLDSIFELAVSIVKGNIKRCRQKVLLNRSSGDARCDYLKIVRWSSSILRRRWQTRVSLR